MFHISNRSSPITILWLDDRPCRDLFFSFFFLHLYTGKCYFDLLSENVYTFRLPQNDPNMARCWNNRFQNKKVLRRHFVPVFFSVTFFYYDDRLQLWLLNYKKTKTSNKYGGRIGLVRSITLSPSRHSGHKAWITVNLNSALLQVYSMVNKAEKKIPRNRAERGENSQLFDAIDG